MFTDLSGGSIGLGTYTLFDASSHLRWHPWHKLHDSTLCSAMPARPCRSSGGNQILLTLTAVPEPSSTALLGLGLSALLLRRKRSAA